jgi:hypothetical protein
VAGVVADDDCDEASRLSGQRARGRIGAVADLARHFADALTRRPSDVALVVERPGHGRDRDTGALGNVLDRGSSRHELHDTSTGITGSERCPREYKLEFSRMKGGFAVTLSRRNLLIAMGVLLAVSVVLIAVFAGGGSAGGGGGY